MGNIISVSRFTEIKGNKNCKKVRTGYHVIYDSPCDYTKSGKLERFYYDDKYVPKTVLKHPDLIDFNDLFGFDL